MCRFRKYISEQFQNKNICINECTWCELTERIDKEKRIKKIKTQFLEFKYLYVFFLT
jgi:hypothetical protein